MFTVRLLLIVFHLKILQVTTHQIAILVLFNSSDSVSVKDIAAETEIETDNDYLQKVISVLLKTKVLLVQNRQLVDDELVTMDDELVCNDKYKRCVKFIWLFFSKYFIVKNENRIFQCPSSQK